MRKLLRVAIGIALLWLVRLQLRYVQQAWVAPSAFGGNSLRHRKHYGQRLQLDGSKLRHLVGLRSYELKRVAEGDRLMSKLNETTLEALEEAGEMQLGMPDERDIEEITELMAGSFDRIFEKKKLKEGAFGPFQYFVDVANSLTSYSNAADITQGLKFRLDLGLQFPSLRRPVKQDETVALTARPKTESGKGQGPLVGYVELCMLVADGRRPEDDDSPSEDGSVREPYISNLCVDPEWRRLGIGRALLEASEDVVRHIWRKDKLYLHIDTHPPPRLLYESAGYTPVSPTGDDGVTHMSKDLEVPPEDPEPEPDLEEEEAEEEGDPLALPEPEGDEATLALPETGNSTALAQQEDSNAILPLSAYIGNDEDEDMDEVPDVVHFDVDGNEIEEKRVFEKVVRLKRRRKRKNLLPEPQPEPELQAESQSDAASDGN
eukprot:TRINITY_DN8939_c2_g1_i1.p1 TRINITY_DN8939_c2_g1~~TRINITY_DN8939_c2_g1_i1.p1  ORF type:complete len:433 (-),score=94.37 TRINITY_DN8939_c2_g1_i1:94-1392(-)